jgi:hypothetical protein
MKFKEDVEMSFENHQCSITNQPNNPTIHELSPWLRVFCWHDLATDHIIPSNAPIDEIMVEFEFLEPANGDFNWDRLPLMIQANHEKTQIIIYHV